MSITALQQMTRPRQPMNSAQWAEWFGSIPGCEVRPSPGSNENCGDPSAGCYECQAAHLPSCTVRPGTFPVWMCLFHNAELIAGTLCCTVCKAKVTLLRAA